MFIYDENETMKLVGKQRITVVDKNKKAIFDVINAYAKHPEYGIIQLATDLFILGYVIGKGGGIC